MEGIVFFWKFQPPIATDFLLILLLLLLGSLVRSLFPLVRVWLWDVPRSLVSAIKEKVETPDSAYAKLQSAEEAFTKLHESTVADVKLMRFICSVMVVLSLMMVGVSAPAVSDDIARLTRFDGSFTLQRAVWLLELLALGLTHCTPLYAVTHALEYLLQRRKIKWRRFLVDAKRVLPVAKL